jgi:hypothetical protein
MTQERRKMGWERYDKMGHERGTERDWCLGLFLSLSLMLSLESSQVMKVMDLFCSPSLVEPWDGASLAFCFLGLVSRCSSVLFLSLLF